MTFKMDHAFQRIGNAVGGSHHPGRLVPILWLKSEAGHFRVESSRLKELVIR